jgi:serine/threonine protein kinase
VLAERYRLDRAIGSGAMGSIYEAVHLGLGRPVAVKVLHPQHVGIADIEARFVNEGRAAGMIASDHIVQTFDVGHDKVHGLFLVTELLEGEDLDCRLIRERRLDVETSITIGRQIARGLAKAHAVGIVHRDLKPANVFLAKRDDGSILAKIVDFGISKRIGEEPSPDGPLTTKGTAVGTPQYMSPEQLAGTLDIDGRADVWSLGVVMYEMLSGAPPFADRRGHLEIMMAIAREDAAPLRTVASWVPSSLAESIDAALVRDRELRTPNASTFAAQIGTAGARRRASIRVRQSGTLRRASSAQSTRETAVLPTEEREVETERDPRLGRRRS